jgi:hypothetical protein
MPIARPGENVDAGRFGDASRDIRGTLPEIVSRIV